MHRSFLLTNLSLLFQNNSHKNQQAYQVYSINSHKIKFKNTTNLFHTTCLLQSFILSRLCIYKCNKSSRDQSKKRPSVKVKIQSSKELDTIFQWSQSWREIRGNKKVSETSLRELSRDGLRVRQWPNNSWKWIQRASEEAPSENHGVWSRCVNLGQKYDSREDRDVCWVMSIRTTELPGGPAQQPGFDILNVARCRVVLTLFG